MKRLKWIRENSLNGGYLLSTASESLATSQSPVADGDFLAEVYPGTYKTIVFLDFRKNGWRYTLNKNFNSVKAAKRGVREILKKGGLV